MPVLCKPRALQPGGAIGIVAPASAVDRAAVESGAELLRRAGFEVVYRDDLFARHRYLAGDDARRAKELMEFVDDPRVGAIVCARGGYGCHRIVDRLDAVRVRAARKPLLGYSDVTTLLLWQRKHAGLVGFHGPMLERALAADEVEALVRALTGTESLPVVLPGSAGRGGRVEGRLVGGSLSLVAASLGTPWEIDTRGGVLLLEDRGERPYRLDRMLEQLRHAGKLAGLAGVGLGAFEACDEPATGLRGAVILQEVLDEVAVPWVSGLPFGHCAPNRTWPLGARAALDGERAELHILERGVVSS